MPTVRMKNDTLNEENLRFEQQPLRQTLFLNSVPKCGSHLLRNIIRMSDVSSATMIAGRNARRANRKMRYTQEGKSR